MCGIYGLRSLNGRALDDRVLTRMGNEMRHRGPDDSGKYVRPEILLGMRRLSIIDVEGGHQPLSNENSTVWAVCNGEIYGFRSLRENLERKGHQFSTRSDSEVLVHLYEEFGDRLVQHLDGMFAFAIWDETRRRLIVGRDRLGIKPLYFFVNEHILAFASELKAILQVPDVRVAIDRIALQEYLTLGYVPAPLSMIEGVHKLPPGTVMTCESGSVRLERYWHLPEPDDECMSEPEWIDTVRASIEEAVVAQMVSDVPVGAFLSGGIDSSAVVAFMARNSSKPIKTYSIGFAEDSGGRYYNELTYARKLAQTYKTDHREILVRPDITSLLPKLLWHMDEPIADAAFITTFLVAEFARPEVKVILSGIGGDELFGGYRRYLGEHYSRWYGNVPRWFRERCLVPIAKRLPSDRHSLLLDISRLAKGFVLTADLSAYERYRSYVRLFSSEEREELLTGKIVVSDMDALQRAFERAGDGDTLYRLMQIDLDTQLPDDLLMLSDRMTMAVSLECRVPLLDDRLVALSASMPQHLKIRGSTLKYVLKKAMDGIVPRTILRRTKRGFGAPIGSWFKSELAPFLAQVLNQRSIEERGIFSWPSVRRTIDLHCTNRRDFTDHLLSLVNFELWCQIYLDGKDPANVAESLSKTGRL